MRRFFVGLETRLPGWGGGIRTSASRKSDLLNFIPPEQDLGVDRAPETFARSAARASSIRDAQVRVLPPRVESLGKFRFYMQRFESRRPNRPVSLERIRNWVALEMPRYRLRVRNLPRAAFLFAEHDMGGKFARGLFGYAEAEPGQVNPSEHRFAVAERDRCDREMYLVNQSRL